MNKECYLCHTTDLSIVEGKVRDYESMKILKCNNCGLIFLETFEHIDNMYYKESKMVYETNLDIETWVKVNYIQNQQRADWLSPLLINKTVLDFGCGEGGFLLDIKPFTKTCLGVEKSKLARERLQNEFKISVFSNIADIPMKNLDVITIFHVIEHLPDPISVLKEISEYLDSKGTIIIETPNANDALLSLYKCKPFSEFTYWGCHLYLFTESTLATMVKKAGFKINYIKQIQRYPLSNHLYWLANGKPNGHAIWECLNTPTLKDAYENLLSNLGICDTLITSISKE
jgi:2-polyprenyl-3-methyl-5-hydroxy-6-metoxy-1,4-benzoquinol methylase